VSSLEHDPKNSTGKTIDFEPSGSDDHFMSLLPRELRDLLLYEAVKDFNPESLYRWYKRFGCDIEKTKAYHLWARNWHTMKAYGKDHPQYYADLEIGSDFTG
jgi:hypothetical protein